MEADTSHTWYYSIQCDIPPALGAITEVLIKTIFFSITLYQWRTLQLSNGMITFPRKFLIQTVSCNIGIRTDEKKE